MEAVWGHRLDRTGLALGLTGLTAPSAHARTGGGEESHMRGASVNDAKMRI